MPTIYSEGYSAIWEMWVELFLKGYIIVFLAEAAPHLSRSQLTR